MYSHVPAVALHLLRRGVPAAEELWGGGAHAVVSVQDLLRALQREFAAVQEPLQALILWNKTQVFLYAIPSRSRPNNSLVYSDCSYFSSSNAKVHVNEMVRGEVANSFRPHAHALGARDSVAACALPFCNAIWLTGI